MQSDSSRIRTRVAVSISYDDNHYTTGTSIYFYNSSHFNSCKKKNMQIIDVSSSVGYNLVGKWIMNFTLTFWRSPFCAVANVLDYDILVDELELQSLCYFHFQTNTLGKGMNRFIPTSYRLNSTTTVLLQRLLLH